MHKETLPADGRLHDPEHLRPQLIAEAEFIAVSPAVIFLKSSRNHTYLKLTVDEAEMARHFDGRQTLSDILEQCLKSSGTRRFSMLFDLLARMRAGGFLSPDSAAGVLPEVGVNSATSPLAVLRQRMRRWLTFTLCPMPLAFDTRMLQRIGCWYSSTVTLMVVAAVACAGFLLWPDLNGVSQLRAFSLQPDATARLFFGSFAAGIAAFWLSVCGIVSLKNVISAYILRGKGCAAERPRAGRPPMTFGERRIGCGRGVTPAMNRAGDSPCAAPARTRSSGPATTLWLSMDSDRAPGGGPSLDQARYKSVTGNQPSRRSALASALGSRAQSRDCPPPSAVRPQPALLRRRRSRRGIRARSLGRGR